MFFFFFFALTGGRKVGLLFMTLPFCVLSSSFGAYVITLKKTVENNSYLRRKKEQKIYYKLLENISDP